MLKKLTYIKINRLGWAQHCPSTASKLAGLQKILSKPYLVLEGSAKTDNPRERARLTALPFLFVFLCLHMTTSLFTRTFRSHILVGYEGYRPTPKVARNCGNVQFLHMEFFGTSAKSTHDPTKRPLLGWAGAPKQHPLNAWSNIVDSPEEIY